MTRTGMGLPALSVASAAILWGLWWLPLRWLDGRGLPGEWASLAVYSLAVALLCPFAWPHRRRISRGGPILLASGVLFGAVLVLWNQAVLLGEVVRVVLLFYLAPVWATLLTVLFLRDRVTLWRALSVVLGLAGAATVLGVEGGIPWPRDEGDWMGLLAGMLFALSAMFAHKGESIEDFDKTFVAFAAAALLALVMVMGGPPLRPTGDEMISAIPLAAAVAGFWILPATWLVFWGASRLDPGRVSILLMLEVVAASASASVLTDEPFGWREVAGCVLILSAGLVEVAPALRRAEASSG